METSELIEVLGRGEDSRHQFKANITNKQPASSREELQRLFQQSGLIHADETPVHGLGVGDIDLTYFGTFFQEQFGETLTEQRLSLP